MGRKAAPVFYLNANWYVEHANAEAWHTVTLPSSGQGSLNNHGEASRESAHRARPYLFQVALEQARRCWVPRSSKAACSLLPRSLRLGELMNFNLRRVLMVKCVFARGSYRYTILFTHTHTQLEQQQWQQCEQFPPFAVQKRNLKKKEERTSLYGAHLCQQENKPLIRSTLTSSTVVNNFSSPFKK